MDRLMNIRGTGRLSLAPDTASVELGIIRKDKDYALAVEASDKLLSALSAALLPLGFKREDIKTSSFNVNTEYDSVRDNGVFRNVFSGYRVDHRLRVEFPFDKDRLSGVLSAVTACAADPEINVSFTVKDRESRRAELLKLAASEARRDAETLAEASGVRLGRLVSVSCEAGGSDFYSPTRFGVNSRPMAKCESLSMDMAPEDISLSESAVFTWEIE